MEMRAIWGSVFSLVPAPMSVTERLLLTWQWNVLHAMDQS